MSHFINRSLGLLLSAAVLTACASTSSDMAKKNPNATSIEVMAPVPVEEPVKAPDKMAVKKTDIMGNSLMTSGKTMDVKAPEATETPAAAKLENLYYVAQTKWEMMSFIEAVNAAELAAALEADSAITVFAPTSDAFAQAGDAPATADMLKGHIVAGTLMAKDLAARAAKGESTLATLAGTELTVYVIGDAVKIADPSGRLYTVVSADNEASNGVLHQINGVFSEE